MYLALHKAQSSFAPDTGINLCQDPELATNPSPFLLLDKSQLDIWVTFSQPGLQYNPSVNLYFHIQTCLLKGSKSILHICLFQRKTRFSMECFTIADTFLLIIAGQENIFSLHAELFQICMACLLAFMP